MEGSNKLKILVPHSHPCFNENPNIFESMQNKTVSICIASNNDDRSDIVRYIMDQVHCNKDGEFVSKDHSLFVGAVKEKTFNHTNHHESIELSKLYHKVEVESLDTVD